MAREEIFFGINIDTGDAIKDFGTLKNRTKALKKELDGTKVGTKRFEQLKTEITKNQATIRRFNRELRQTKSLATRVGQGVTNAFKGIAGAFAGAFAAQGVFNFFKNASETIANFEQQLAKVKAVTGATTKEFENLKRSAKELGASSQFTATQVGELQEEFAKLGFSTNEILAATEATLDLATATQSDLGQAATVAASTIRGFGLDAKETQRVTDVMAASFTQSSLDINKFQTAMASVAPVAKSAGVSLEQTTAILGKITDSGVDASTAGTALRNIYLKLAESGMTWDEALNSINTATDKNARALELFGTRGATVATIIANNTTNIEEFTAALEDSTGAASDMADIVGDTLQGDLKALGSAWEGLILSFEEGNNVVRSTTKGLTDIVKSVTTLNEASAVFEEFGFEEDLTGFFGNVNAEALAFFVRAKTINKQLVDNAGNQEALNLLLEDYTRALEINEKSTEENAEARVNLYNKAIESTKLAIPSNTEPPGELRLICSSLA
jgi:phage-related minor tail protein